MSTLVSISCITFNHEKYIAEALESFLMQKTNFEFEILIHDDASKDRTQEIIKDYAKRYPDIIKPILQTENQYSKGVKRIMHTYNDMRAKGKYIALCEGDDYWTDPYKLQKQIDYMESNEECTLCFHASNIVNSQNDSKEIMRPYSNNMKCSMEDVIIGGGGFMPTQSIVYRKDSLVNPPEFYYKSAIGDYPLQLIVASQGYAYYIDETMAVYRKVMSAGASWSNRNKSIEAIKKHNNEIIWILNEFNKYTNSKFISAVNKAKVIINFDNLVLDQNIKELRKDEYKEYFNSLGLVGKIKIYVRCFLPNVYHRLRDIRYK